MSDKHELTLREYYESFAQSLIEDTEEYKVTIDHLEPEIIYIGQDMIDQCEVIEILDDTDSDFDCLPQIIRESPKKTIQNLKVQHPNHDPLMLGRSKSLKAFCRNEDDSLSRRVTRSSKKI
ncbi:uncharacterized protein [Chironomus tepperi]|uniref:uncharacterized protein n=1 Tax=Chironomus tepperi TaxID=113505 RepID=UPI00391F5B90